VSQIDLRLGRWQDVLADMADGSVRLLLTSPPYDNARTYEGTHKGPVDFGELGRFALRVLCPGGVLAMVLDGAVNDGEQSITPYRVICDWAALDGWRFRQFLIYGRGGTPGAWHGWFRRDHEPLLIFVRDGAREVCAKERVAARVPVYRSGGMGYRANGTRRAQDRERTADVTNRGSIWWYGPGGRHLHSNLGHPAPFAEAFALDAVTVWSNPGDLVCDPYSGAGTVARACKVLGRGFVGAEVVPRYHAIAQRRLAEMAQRALLEAP
jgi:DNA modification methylase